MLLVVMKWRRMRWVGRVEGVENRISKKKGFWRGDLRKITTWKA